MIRTLNGGRRSSCLTAVFLVAGVSLCLSAAPDPPQQSYYFYVCAESDDQVAIVRYGPEGAEVYGDDGELVSIPEGELGEDVSPSLFFEYTIADHFLFALTGKRLPARCPDRTQRARGSSRAIRQSQHEQRTSRRRSTTDWPVRLCASSSERPSC